MLLYIRFKVNFQKNAEGKGNENGNTRIIYKATIIKIENVILVGANP
jgi:hypothetical protein